MSCEWCNVKNITSPGGPGAIQFTNDHLTEFGG